MWAGSTVLDEGAGVAVDRAAQAVQRRPDASHVHEFDLKAKAFVSEADGGFVVGEAKTQMVYKDRDTLLIGTDLGGARHRLGVPAHRARVEARHEALRRALGLRGEKTTSSRSRRTTATATCGTPSRGG